MKIPIGKSVGIVGASGAGKTTIVDILLGLLQLESGRILADGVEGRGHQHLRVFKKRPGNADTLPLPAGDPDAPLADARIKPLRQPPDELINYLIFGFLAFVLNYVLYFVFASTLHMHYMVMISVLRPCSLLMESMIAASVSLSSAEVASSSTNTSGSSKSAEAKKLETKRLETRRLETKSIIEEGLGTMKKLWDWAWDLCRHPCADKCDKFFAQRLRIFVLALEYKCPVRPIGKYYRQHPGQRRRRHIARVATEVLELALMFLMVDCASLNEYASKLVCQVIVITSRPPLFR